MTTEFGKMMSRIVARHNEIRLAFSLKLLSVLESVW